LEAATLQEKKKLSAKEILADTRAGATDDFLMKKYGLTEKGIQSLFKKLVDAKIMTQSELDQRASLDIEEVYEVSVEEAEEETKPAPSKKTSPRADGVSTCPACGFSQGTAFDECPGCGIIVSKHQRKRGKRIRPAPTGDAVEETPKAPKTGKTDKEGLTGTDLREVAEFQKVIILLVPASLGLILFAALHPLVYLIASLVLAVFSIYCLYRIGKAMKQSVAYLVAIIIFSIIPCINLVVLLFVNASATKVLRAHGIKVGLLGAKKEDLDQQT
jgi:hypothetical protein